MHHDDDDGLCMFTALQCYVIIAIVSGSECIYDVSVFGRMRPSPSCARTFTRRTYLIKIIRYSMHVSRLLFINPVALFTQTIGPNK